MLREGCDVVFVDSLVGVVSVNFACVSLLAYSVGGPHTDLLDDHIFICVLAGIKSSWMEWNGKRME